MHVPPRQLRLVHGVSCNNGLVPSEAFPPRFGCSPSEDPGFSKTDDEEERRIFSILYHARTVDDVNPSLSGWFGTKNSSCRAAHKGPWPRELWCQKQTQDHYGASINTIIKNGIAHIYCCTVVLPNQQSVASRNLHRCTRTQPTSSKPFR